MFSLFRDEDVAGVRPVSADVLGVFRVEEGDPWRDPWSVVVLEAGLSVDLRLVFVPCLAVLFVAADFRDPFLVPCLGTSFQFPYLFPLLFLIGVV